jgi:hypothetical protein
VGFVVDQVALGQLLHEVSHFFLVNVILPVLHIQLYVILGMDSGPVLGCSPIQT